MKTEKHVISFLLIVSLLFPALANAQYKFDNVLYGAAYYHEYMPADRLDKDIQMMKDCGLSVVRVGESSWGLFEPREGEFEFEWMDRIIDKMHQANIKVILGTPTYAIPAWMAEKHPEVLAVVGMQDISIRPTITNSGKTYIRIWHPGQIWLNIGIGTLYIMGRRHTGKVS